MAYADETAIERTLETGVAHFFSRSRQKLWKKGESSGNTLGVRSVWVDCDGDTLIYMVDPAGPSLPHRRTDLLLSPFRRQWRSHRSG